MISFLRKNKEFERDNIRKLHEEIAVLGFANPTLVTFGRDAETIAKRHLGGDFRIIRIPHYANYISKQGAGANALPRVAQLGRSADSGRLVKED